jgi:decaprenylphospho-beta-D-erythro-pentofuranosid-2-ulose 2-reductase
MSQRILIIGATSAIAQDVARAYAQRGARLFLIGRDADKLNQLAASLGSNVVGTRVADFNDTQNADALVADAWDATGGLDVVCIAHGLLGDQVATERDVTAAEHVIRTNFLSVVALLIPLGNRFEQARAGHIAVLSSVAGDRGRPRNYTYGAAKGALNIYLQGLRTRLWPAGVRVHTLKLGPVDSPMTATHRKHILFARTADVAAQIIAAIDAGSSVAYVPWFWRPIMFGVRIFPESLIQRLGFLSGR